MDVINKPELVSSEEHPDTFDLPGWKLFRPGKYKEGTDYYTLEDCESMVRNFHEFSTGDNALIHPVVRLGHDVRQRLKQSLGLPNVGQISNVYMSEDGWFTLDLVNIPKYALGIDENSTAIQIDLEPYFRRRNFNGGSIEIDTERDFKNPRDPGKSIGPILCGVAILGEERPAVPAPPMPDVMSAKYRTYDIGGRKVVAFSAKYSFGESIMRPELEAKLKDFGIDPACLANCPDDALQKILDNMQSESFAAACKAKYGMSDGMDGSGGSTSGPDGIAKAAKMGVASPDGNVKTDDVIANTKPQTRLSDSPDDGMKKIHDQLAAISNQMSSYTHRLGALESQQSDTSKKITDAEDGLKAAAMYSKSAKTANISRFSALADAIIVTRGYEPILKRAIENELKEAYGKETFSESGETALKQVCDKYGVSMVTGQTFAPPTGYIPAANIQPDPQQRPKGGLSPESRRILERSHERAPGFFPKAVIKVVDPNSPLLVNKAN